MRRKLRAGLAGICLLLSIGPAQAAFLEGQTLQVTYFNPDLSTPVSSANVVVGAGTELNDFSLASSGTIDIDILDASIVIRAVINAAFGNVAFEGFRFTDINGTIPAFTGVASSRVTFDDDNLFINLSDLTILRNDFRTFDITFSDAVVSPVPEPATLGLIAMGAGLLALGRRRSRDTCAVPGSAMSPI